MEEEITRLEKLLYINRNNRDVKLFYEKELGILYKELMTKIILDEMEYYNIGFDTDYFKNAIMKVLACSFDIAKRKVLTKFPGAFNFCLNV